MKRQLIAASLAVAAGSAAANAPFDFQLQFGSEEYVHGIDAGAMTFAPVTPGDRGTSRDAVFLAADVDGIAPNAVQGMIEPSGPSRISLWEVHRGSPEGIAYRQYHERYPADTDWDRIAREWRGDIEQRGLAAEVHDDDRRS
jgi:hypothetical protein